MNDWQQFLIVLAIASGILAAVSLFGRVKALEKAAKAAPVTPDKPPVDPFTAEDVVAFLDREATQREGWATQARLLAEGGISRDMNVSLAKDYGRDVSMFRCAAQRLRATIAAEEVA